MSQAADTKAVAEDGVHVVHPHAIYTLATASPAFEPTSLHPQARGTSPPAARVEALRQILHSRQLAFAVDRGRGAGRKKLGTIESVPNRG